MEVAARRATGRGRLAIVALARFCQQRVYLAAGQRVIVFPYRDAARIQDRLRFVLAESLGQSSSPYATTRGGRPVLSGSAHVGRSHTQEASVSLDIFPTLVPVQCQPSW